MNIHKFVHYREILREGIQRERGLLGTKLPFGEIARHCGMQNTYFSNVLKERAELSADQAFRLAEFLRFSDSERDYFLLVLEWERSGHARRKKALRERIDELRRERLATKNVVDADPVKINLESDARYFLDPTCLLVHAFVRIPRFASQPQKIAEALGLGQAQLAQALKTLQELGHLEIKAGKITVLKGLRQHLADDSVFCSPHQNLFRLQSIHHLQRHLDAPKKTTLVTFSADDETRIKIEGEIAEFIKRCQKWVSQAPSENVYQLNLDFFPWNRE